MKRTQRAFIEQPVAAVARGIAVDGEIHRRDSGARRTREAERAILIAIAASHKTLCNN